MPDLNKEIKLSDLFRRRAKELDQPVAELPPEEKPPRERRALFSRARREAEPRAPKSPKEPKQPKERRAGRGAAGVAERSAPAPPQVPLMRAFDLMPKEEARDKRSRTALPQVAVALLGLALVAGLGAVYLFTSAGVTTKQGELDDLRAQLAELEAAAAPDEGAGALAGEGQARTAALSAALATRVAWDRVLREVSLVLPEDVWLTTLSASTPNATGEAAAVPADGTAPNTLSLNGFAEYAESVAQLLSRLSAVPEFATVELQSLSRDTSTEDGAYAFAVVVGVDPLGVPAS